MSRRRGLPWVAAAAAAIVVAHGAGSHPAKAAPAPPAAVADAAVPARPPAPAPGLKAVAFARAQLGKPYLWGGTGPGAFDCSGLAYEAWRHAGVSIPRTTFEQWPALRHISRSQLRPGDLAYFAGSDGSADNPGHVVIYIGHGQVIQAFRVGVPVEITPLSSVDAGALAGFARP